MGKLIDVKPKAGVMIDVKPKMGQMVDVKPTVANLMGNRNRTYEVTLAAGGLMLTVPLLTYPTAITVVQDHD